MERQAAKERIAELRAVLLENSRKYYVDNAPTMSDYDFDMTMKELEALEAEWPEFVTEDSPTRRVGSDLAATDVQKGFAQYPHRYPMLSLGNTYNIGEIEEFAARSDKALEGNSFTYCCELKFDGTSICLNYVHGKLFRALTRGDGAVGDDVTANVRRISNVPQTLSGEGWPDDFEIRGEVLMPYEAFERLNAEREADEEPPFANPRNAASGSLKLQNPEEVAHRGLWCTLYHIPSPSVSFETHEAALEAAKSWGLPVSDDRRICRDIEGIEEYIAYWDKARRSLPFATDGIVIKINELEYQTALGYTAKSPRWAVAYKFQAERALTEVLSIDYQVGRTGAVTPVANLESVPLSGTIVKRATLNNADQMALMDIRIGDWVYVEKGGEIIPKITEVELSRRPANAVRPQFPKLCPDCGTPLVRQEDEAKWFCPNVTACPTQMKGRIVHFMSRKAMNINAGGATVEQFFDSGLARTPADLYDIHFDKLTALDGWQKKAADNFLGSLEASREVPFERVLFALGIRYVGDTKAKLLARHFGDVDAIAMATEEEIAAVPEIGRVIAHSVCSYFEDARNAIEVQRLREHGLQFSVRQSDGGKSDALSGKTIVISGNFSISREEMKALIERHGGKNSSSLSGRTSFLLAGSKPGPEKIKNCEELGVMIISEEAFRALLPELQEENRLVQAYQKLLASAQIHFEGSDYTIAQMTPFKTDADDARRLAAWKAEGGAGYIAIVDHDWVAVDANGHKCTYCEDVQPHTYVNAPYICDTCGYEDLKAARADAKAAFDEAAGENPTDAMKTVLSSAKSAVDAAETVAAVTAAKETWLPVIELRLDKDTAIAAVNDVAGETPSAAVQAGLDAAYGMIDGANTPENVATIKAAMLPVITAQVAAEDEFAATL